MTDLQTALNFHITYKLYPSPPAGVTKIAQKAIELWNSGKRDVEIDISSVATHRIWGIFVPVAVVLEQWNLWGFVRDN